MSFVTFIIPSKGRETLKRTLDSLIAQTDPDWDAVVVFDGFPASRLPEVDDPRIFSVSLITKMGEGHFAGYVRNYGFGLTRGQWLGFVDDDDRLDHQYVSWLKQEADGHDMIVFRMIYPPEAGGGVLPVDNLLGAYKVGISFAVRSRFQLQRDVWFEAEEFEDWYFIERCQQRGAKIKVSPRIAYYVRH